MTSRRTALILIWLMMLVAYIDRVNITLAGPAIMKAFHVGPGAFGAVLAAFTLGYAAMQIPGGVLADRFGTRGLLIAAISIWSFFTGLTGFALSIFALVAVRVLFGLGEGLENGAQFKLIADRFDSRERSRANGFFLSALALGPAIAAPAATWLLGLVGWRGLFFWSVLPGLIVATLLYSFLPGAASGQDLQSGPTSLADSPQPLQRPPMPWLPFVAYMLFNSAFWGFIGWMPTYLSATRHIKLADLGVTASIPYLSGFAGLLVLGAIGGGPAYRFRSLLTASSYILAAAFLWVAFTSRSVPGCIFGLSLAAFFLYGGFGPFWAVSMDRIAAHLRGTATGFVNFGGQIGGFIAPMIVGQIAAATKSFNGGFEFMICSLILSAVTLCTMQVSASNNVSEERV